MKDSFIHHKANSIVKTHAKTKDTRIIWEQACKTTNESFATLMNGDATLAYLVGL